MTLRRLNLDLVLKSNKFDIIIDVPCPHDLYMEESLLTKTTNYEALGDSEGQSYEEDNIMIYVCIFNTVSLLSTKFKNVFQDVEEN